MSVELSVKVKDCDRRLQKDFLLYESFTFDYSDVTIQGCVDEVVKEFQGEPDTIEVRATMVIL